MHAQHEIYFPFLGSQLLDLWHSKKVCQLMIGYFIVKSYCFALAHRFTLLAVLAGTQE